MWMVAPASSVVNSKMKVPVSENVTMFEEYPEMPEVPKLTAEGSVMVCAVLATVSSSLIRANVPADGKLLNAKLMLPLVVAC